MEIILELLLLVFSLALGYGVMYVFSSISNKDLSNIPLEVFVAIGAVMLMIIGIPILVLIMIKKMKNN